MTGISKNNFTFKLWIVFISFILIWFAIICSGKGEGLNIGFFTIKPISTEAIAVLMFFAKEMLLPLVKDVTGTIKAKDDNINIEHNDKQQF